MPHKKTCLHGLCLLYKAYKSIHFLSSFAFVNQIIQNGFLLIGRIIQLLQYK